jgi:hypothetical protein
MDSREIPEKGQDADLLGRMFHLSKGERGLKKETLPAIHSVFPPFVNRVVANRAA